jgi:DNA-binding MarR family transcriptional regulator
LDWRKYAYAVASGRRTDIILLLFSGSEMPREIAEKTNLRLSHVSNVLSGLVKNGISLCLTPEQSKSRLYSLTDDGKEIASELIRRKEKAEHH